MSLTQKQIEYLHNIGKMPDWAYYQMNGRDAQSNYNDIKNEKSIEDIQQKEIEDKVIELVKSQIQSIFNI